MNSKPRWFTPLFPQLRLCPLEGEYAAFNPLSGQTHFLNGLSLEVLRLLHENEGLSESQLVDAFNNGCDSADLDKFRLSLGTHIHHLDELGLIARVDD